MVLLAKDSKDVNTGMNATASMFQFPIHNIFYLLLFKIFLSIVINNYFLVEVNRVEEIHFRQERHLILGRHIQQEIILIGRDHLTRY
jgi:hypothetical protein